MERACGNCDQTLVGAYCHACGQKRIGDGDRRLGHLLGQLLSAATDLDGRFWRSLRTLVLEPGRLSREYLDGRRRAWMSPMSLFLLANVLYFLAPGTATDFNLPLADQVRHQVHSPVTRSWVEARVAARDRDARATREALPEEARAAAPAGYTFADYAMAYDVQTGNVGKALLVLHVPFIALGLLALFPRRRMYFAEHLVVATHLFAYALMYMQAVLLPLEWIIERAGLHAHPSLPWVLATVVGGLALHFGFAVARVYGVRWRAIAAPFVLIFAMMFGNVVFYRAVQFALTYWLT